MCDKHAKRSIPKEGIHPNQEIAFGSVRSPEPKVTVIRVKIPSLMESLLSLPNILLVSLLLSTSTKEDTGIMFSSTSSVF